MMGLRAGRGCGRIQVQVGGNPGLLPAGYFPGIWGRGATGVGVIDWYLKCSPRARTTTGRPALAGVAGMEQMVPLCKGPSVV